jgi:RNA polymerase sigma-70 factor (ECF subfamily)
MFLSDDVLMKQIMDGDMTAFTTLMDRYQDKALRFCFRHLGDYHLSEDISQDAFINLYQKAKQYKPEGKFILFFYKMLTNLCLDVPKKLRYRSLATHNPGLEEVLITDNPITCFPTQALETNETQNMVREAINNLPVNYRQIIILRELEGLKYHEIAQIMGCSINKIKVWIHRAKKQLAERLRPQMTGMTFKGIP